MQLYFSPGACSMATRISLYEAGAAAIYVQVDSRTKKTADGKDFHEINPLGQVPVLRTDGGDVITQNAAILQYVADHHPAASLAPPGGMGRTRLQEWLGFIGTELHKGLFTVLMDAKIPEAAKAIALEKGAVRLAVLEKHLTGREFLLEQFSVADAYLLPVLGWTAVTPVDLKKWPGLGAYLARLHQRPSVARALSEEMRLYAEEQALHR